MLNTQIFFLPTDPNILEHASGNTCIFFLGLTSINMAAMQGIYF